MSELSPSPRTSPPHFRQRLHKLLNLPTDSQQQQELCVCFLPEVAKLIASYSQVPTSELVYSHVTHARDDFLTVSECLSVLECVDTSHEFWSVFLPYLRSMFAGLPKLQKWPYHMQLRAIKRISQSDHFYNHWDWASTLQERAHALHVWHEYFRVVCPHSRGMHSELVKALLRDSELLVSSFPDRGSSIGHNFEMARRTGWRHCGFLGLVVMSFGKILSN
jgi:hypothetical protein